ncbi:MAG: DUF3784 domain-containing protein [Dehalococcoidales bacterium]|jgi:uncharacterized membrane protein|nr:DUF3784 domain-containing protein [Dehalococcoidales bacterium]MDD3264357.1 DUF3784 domain-containing protein [Dehalococcoidales bacterium]MDD4322123.1 DUF3784 domain-containing protein [Dehalococcoidales bacterium]MDD4793693.1 DUF3784 domain-containing protein [Dehalococcoidales bacterium]MDD5122019.1 DUF3784 domain-containing protein [Dehalococcoidales bacterium]
MWIANLASGALLLFLGFITRVFKLSMLVAGYNTASEEEKKKIDEKKMTRYVGNLLMIAAGILLVFGLVSLWFEFADYLFWISWGLFLAVIIGGLVYLNTGKRLEKE